MAFLKIKKLINFDVKVWKHCVYCFIKQTTSFGIKDLVTLSNLFASIRIKFSQKFAKNQSVKNGALRNLVNSYQVIQVGSRKLSESASISNVGQNGKKPSKNLIEKFVKLTDDCTHNNSTNFGCEAHAMTGNGSLVNC